MSRFSFFLLALITLSLHGQTSLKEIEVCPQKSGGVLFAYPYKPQVYTEPPKGYVPFYISHYGRHGSRYLTSTNEFTWVYNLLVKAQKENALTALGEDVLSRLEYVVEETRGREGDLSSKGVRELRGIADRMYHNYPAVFTEDIDISARSTLVVRCVLSMDAFSERLKELNPNLNIAREASNRYMFYLNPHSEEAIAFRSADDTWREEYRKFRKQHINPSRLTKSLFVDETFVIKKVNPEALMESIFQIAGNMQNLDLDMCFYDLFEAKELFDIWQCYNYHNYVSDGPSSLNGGLMPANSKLLLKNIIDSANNIISSNSKSVTLRFGHDGNLIPLASLMHIENCYESIDETSNFYKVWTNFKVAPMAANIQIIFYRKTNSEDILVKVLHNEREVLIPPLFTEISPYYKWRELEEFYNNLINKQ